MIRLYEEGETIIKAAEIAGINKNTASSIIKRYESDGCTIIERNRGGKRRCKLPDDVLNLIETLIEENPCTTLSNIKRKICEIKQINMSKTSVFNGLKQLCITLKNATMNFDRLNCENTIKLRQTYALHFSQHAPQPADKLVFIDESGFNYHLRRTKARSKVNTAAHVIIPTARGRNVSLIAAMNFHGIIHRKVIPNSTVNSNIFVTFLNELINKLAKRSITGAWLILDNAAIHKTQEVRDKVSETSHELCYLSPYSPMLNPIEKVFSKTKLSARNLLADPDNQSNLVNVIQQSLETVTPADCNNYFVDMSMKLPMAVLGQPLH